MKKKLTIEGMHCASCAGNVERSLKNVPRVKSVAVSLMTKKGFVEADGNIADDVLKKAVARAGYRVTNVENQ